MISRLRGTLLEKSAAGAVVEAGGVGYDVVLSPGALLRLPAEGQEVRLFIVESMALYGGGTTLYGFPSEGERRIFNVLRENVPNTGAKKALELLEKAAKSLPGFCRAVADRDARSLVAGFGFTPKTAERLIAGLQDKLEVLPAAEDAPAAGGSALDEAVAGLVALGYREPAARQAARAAQTAGRTPQDIIRESLRHLSGRD